MCFDSGARMVFKGGVAAVVWHCENIVLVNLAPSLFGVLVIFFFLFFSLVVITELATIGYCCPTSKTGMSTAPSIWVVLYN